MPNEIAPAQMLRMASPYPERTRSDTSSGVRIYLFGITFEASSAWVTATYNGRQGSQVTGRGGRAVSELSMETQEEDEGEQATEVPDENGDELSELPFEVNEADAAEQTRDAGYENDDEDYR